jgi:hypothetical protein
VGYWHAKGVACAHLQAVSLADQGQGLGRPADAVDGYLQEHGDAAYAHAHVGVHRDVSPLDTVSLTMVSALARFQGNDLGGVHIDGRAEDVCAYGFSQLDLIVGEQAGQLLSVKR